jgi:hypothetical protein
MKKLFGIALMALMIGMTSCAEDEVAEPTPVTPVGTADVCCSGCIIGVNECYTQSADRFVMTMTAWKAVKETEGCNCVDQ